MRQMLEIPKPVADLLAAEAEHNIKFDVAVVQQQVFQRRCAHAAAHHQGAADALG